MNDPHDPFQAMLRAYAAAVLAKDVDAFVALYDPEVRIFDMWGQWSLHGTEAWRAMAQDWFGSLGDERVVVGVEEAHAIVGEDLAAGHAMLRYTAWSAAGERLRSLDTRLSCTLRRRDGAWKIVHEHTSAPIDHATTQALLQRP